MMKDITPAQQALLDAAMQPSISINQIDKAVDAVRTEQKFLMKRFYPFYNNHQSLLGFRWCTLDRTQGGLALGYFKHEHEAAEYAAFLEGKAR